MLNASAGDLLRAVASWRTEAAVAFERLIPELNDARRLNPVAVEFRGCLLNREALESPHLEEWFEDRFSDEQREYALNHVHLWDVARMPAEDRGAGELTERLREFLPVLAEFWRWQLNQQTSKPVHVWIADDPDEYGPTIGFGFKR